MSPTIRSANPDDNDAIWAILEPTIRAGETYALPRDGTRADMLATWFCPGSRVFVAVSQGVVRGTYSLKANQSGGGDHVANAGFMTHPAASGRGIAHALALHALDTARDAGFAAMQFNFVVSTNTRAIALWERLGFRIVGRLPEAFRHPLHGAVDALVMHRTL